MRINVYLALAGVASRRKAGELIKQGKVTINGLPAQLNSAVEPKDVVAIDGKTVKAHSYKYLMLNKPKGYITSLQDPEGRPMVMDLVKAEARLVPVGRLDFNTEGLLILTNDGKLARNLMHPSQGVVKTYHASVSGKVTPETLKQLSDGVALEDGPTSPAKASLVNGNTIELAIHEGKNRQVRRMMQAVGLKLTRLIRVAYGPLALDGLSSGSYRQLTTKEVAMLKKLSDTITEDGR